MMISTGTDTTCVRTCDFFGYTRSIFRPWLFLGGLGPLAVRLILDALLFGLPGFGFLMTGLENRPSWHQPRRAGFVGGMMFTWILASFILLACWQAKNHRL